MEMFDLFFISFFQLYFMSQQCNYIHCPLSMQVWLLLLVMKCKPTGRGPCLDFGCVPSKAIKNTSIIKLCAFTLCRASVLIEKNNQDVTANFFFKGLNIFFYFLLNNAGNVTKACTKCFNQLLFLSFFRLNGFICLSPRRLPIHSLIEMLNGAFIKRLYPQCTLCSPTHSR